MPLLVSHCGCIAIQIGDLPVASLPSFNWVEHDSIIQELHESGTRNWETIARLLQNSPYKLNLEVCEDDLRITQAITWVWALLSSYHCWLLNLHSRILCLTKLEGNQIILKLRGNDTAWVYDLIRGQVASRSGC